jgi:hypothetical protein
MSDPLTPVRRSVGFIVFTLLLIAALAALFMVGSELVGVVNDSSSVMNAADQFDTSCPAA